MTVLDSTGMFDATRRVPETTEAAVLVTQDAALDLPHDLRSVVLVGDGMARWSAEVAAAIVSPSSSIPVVVTSGQAGLPKFVDDTTLVIDVAAAARRTSLRIGGEQLDLGIDVPHVRVALGAICAAVLTVLERTARVGELGTDLDHAIGQLHQRRNALFGDNSDADRLARRIGRLFPLVYGEGDIGRLAAQRWKRQVNVNAKAPAYAGSLPELGHDEIAGFGQHGDVTRQVMCAVLLRHDHEAAGAQAQFGVLDEVLVESVAAVHEVRAAGNGRLAQLLDLAYVGDVVSLHLAANEGLDPGPAPFLAAG